MIGLTSLILAGKIGNVRVAAAATVLAFCALLIVSLWFGMKPVLLFHVGEEIPQ